MVCVAVAIQKRSFHSHTSTRSADTSHPDMRPAFVNTSCSHGPHCHCCHKTRHVEGTHARRCARAYAHAHTMGTAKKLKQGSKQRKKEILRS